MSDTPTSQPAAPIPTPVQPPRRLRRVLFATVLLLTGGVIGAVATTTASSFGPGAHAWHSAHGHGFGGPEFGHRAFFPGRIERGTDRVLSLVDASTEQRQKINGIVNRAADDIYALRGKHIEGRRQIRDALAAASIDRARIEALRVEQMALADTASRRISDAMAEAAETLNPAQRADLARRMERWERWFRG